MKRFNQLFAGTIIGYFIIVLLFLFLYKENKDQNDREYLVEANRIMKALDVKGGYEEPKLNEGDAIKKVYFLPTNATESINSSDDSKEKDIADFYEAHNGFQTYIVPFYIKGQLAGYVRFDYKKDDDSSLSRYFLYILFTFIGIGIFTLLMYIKKEILNPFFKFSEMPYQISKGHLNYEVEENRNHFFGKFLWGISMLEDTLNDAKMKELKLQKEKKLLLLSISHDIKTPVNTIRLYAQALEQNIYSSEEEKKQAAISIQKQTEKIDDFVKEIMRTSREEILSIEVVNTEFYLKDLMDMVQEHFSAKCKLKQINFIVEDYDNKLLKGDLDRTLEVIENLMENAFKYGDGKQISIYFSEEEYCQLIHIENTGSPVKDTEMMHLFDSFFRGSNVEGKNGNGLGLYICKEIMTKMEGDIFAECKKDGMSFVLVIHE